jgi:hypothetical protein
MVLYPLSIRIQRAEEHLNRSMYEELSIKIPKEGRILKGTGTVMMTIPCTRTAGSGSRKHLETNVILYGFRPHLFVNIS